MRPARTRRGNSTPNVDRLEALFDVLRLGKRAPPTLLSQAGPLPEPTPGDRLELALKDPLRAGAARALAAMGPQATPGLLASLRGGVATAAAALGALELLADERAVTALAGQLEQRNRRLRARAAAALVAIGAPCVETLTRVSPECRGVVEALRALGRIGDPRAVPYLAERLSDRRRALRAEAARALVAIGAASVPALVALASPDAVGLLEATHALGNIGDARAASCLATLLRHERQDVRSAATYGLIRIGPPAVAPTAAMISDSHRDGSLCAVTVLSRVANEAAAEVLQASLRSTDPAIRRMAAIGLGRAPCPSMPQQLVATLNDASAEVRVAAAWALGKQEEPAPVEALEQAAADRDPRVRRAAVVALGRHDPRCPAIEHGLGDEAPSVRVAAAWALAASGRAWPQVLEERLSDAAWHVRRAAAGALTELGWQPGTPQEQALCNLATSDWESLLSSGTAPVGWLLESLGAADPRLRRLAAAALIRLGSVVTEPVRAVLAAENTFVRAGAARVLGGIGSTSAIEALVERLGDSDPSVRRSAARALNHLGDFRGDVEPLPKPAELESDCGIDYQEIVAAAPGPDAEDVASFLAAVLPNEWASVYAAQCPHRPNVSIVPAGPFEYLFDCPTELVKGWAMDERGLVKTQALDERAAVADRVVAVHGRSGMLHAERDDSRMQPFPMGPAEIRYAGSLRGRYDKGHFMGHALGGGLDINLFPQVAATNEGSSEAGRKFRDMERYVLERPGTYCFARPLYAGFSGHPLVLEFGVLRDDGSLWVESFDNMLTPAEAEELERLYREGALKRLAGPP